MLTSTKTYNWLITSLLYTTKSNEHPVNNLYLILSYVSWPAHCTFYWVSRPSPDVCLQSSRIEKYHHRYQLCQKHLLTWHHKCSAENDGWQIADPSSVIAELLAFVTPTHESQCSGARQKLQFSALKRRPMGTKFLKAHS